MKNEDQIKQLEEELELVKKERDNFRAVLEGAEYRMIDKYKTYTKEDCFRIGVEVKEQTIKLIQDAKYL